MEVSQFTYFQQVAGFECAPVSGELTYGLERLAMYVQGVENVYDLNFNGGEGADKVTYGDVFLQAEQEYSRHNFEDADTAMLFQHFKDAEAECKALLEQGEPRRERQRHAMALPAYDQCIKASHVFNLLDARGVISVTERQSYILRVRELAKACGAAWLQTEGGRSRPERRDRLRSCMRALRAGAIRLRRSPVDAQPGRRGDCARQSGSACDDRRRSAGTAPIPVDVKAGETYWWCSCGQSKNQPFCDGSHQGSAFMPMEWTADADKRGVLLHLQADRQVADVRRQPQQAVRPIALSSRRREQTAGVNLPANAAACRVNHVRLKLVN